MKKIGSILVAIIVAVTAFALVGCGEKKAARTAYDISATLEGHALTVKMTVSYVNNNETPLGDLYFNLPMQAYREGAKFSPIEASQTSSAFPSGVASYSSFSITRLAVDGVEQTPAIGGEDENALIVAFSSPLEYCDGAKIEIDYTLNLPNIRHRLGYYGNSVNLGNFYPIACVYEGGEFVCDPYYSIGDPFTSDIADYSVTLTAPSEYVAAFTGGVESETRLEETTTYKSNASGVRDFAIMLGSFERASSTSGTTVVNYYYYSDSAPQESLQAAIDALDTFGSMFGAYPLPSYSVVQTPFVYGGMEYPGLVMISDAYTDGMYKDIIIHETAHQWWYGAVGNNQVKDAWLDEALAEYSTMLFYDANPDYGITYADKLADCLTSYIVYCDTYKNGGRDDTSFNRALNEYSGSTEYNYLVYVKGALMLGELRTRIGDATFKSALKSYYAKFNGKTAKADDLIGEFETASKTELKGYFDSWLAGKVWMFSKI